MINNIALEKPAIIVAIRSVYISAKSKIQSVMKCELWNKGHHKKKSHNLIKQRIQFLEFMGSTNKCPIKLNHFVKFLLTIYNSIMKAREEGYVHQHTHMPTFNNTIVEIVVLTHFS